MKDDALIEDMFGSHPFALHGSVGASGADNHRPDVAKIENLLGDAGYYKPMTDSGPNGGHNPNLDSAIRSFQKDKGLQVDGLLKPGGPTQEAIDRYQAEYEKWARENLDKIRMNEDLERRGLPTIYVPSPPRDPRKPFDERDMGDIMGSGGGFKPPRRPEAQQPQQQPPAAGNGPTITMGGNGKPVIVLGGRPTRPRMPDLFPGHTISEAGAQEHEDWAKLLKRDAKPEETARILNVAITDHGDQGAADAADLLGRFAQHDPQKAETLRTLVSRQAGREVPFRIAPLGEGFREPSMEEKLAQAPKSPFGPTDGADMEAAGSMAKALLKKGDYQDAYAYLKSAPEATPPYMAAVHDFMRQENPGLAMKFAEQGVQNGMAKPVQVAQAETGTKTDAVPTSAPPPSGPQPASPSNPDDDIGRQLGMPVPGSEPAQPSPSPAPSGQPEPKPDEKPDPSTSPQWQPDKGMMSSGEHVTRTNGPIRIDRHSITPGLDGIVYNVEWFPLDKDGNVEPTIRKAGKEPDWGGHMVPGVEKDIHKPPYDHPNGWEVRVSIPPGQKYNNISGKPWLNILVPPKGQGRDRQ